METEQLIGLLGQIESDGRVRRVLGPALGDPDPINDPCIDYAIAANAYLRIARGYYLVVMETYPLAGHPYEDDTGYVGGLWITRDNIQSDGVRLELPADLRWDLTIEEFSLFVSKATRSSGPEVSPQWHSIPYRGFELVVRFYIINHVVKVDEVAISLPSDWEKFQRKFSPRSE